LAAAGIAGEPIDRAAAQNPLPRRYFGFFLAHCQFTRIASDRQWVL